jgi:hypothetical protein
VKAVTAADGVNSIFYKRFIDVSRELLRVERRTAVQLAINAYE